MHDEVSIDRRHHVVRHDAESAGQSLETPRGRGFRISSARNTRNPKDANGCYRNQQHRYEHSGDLVNDHDTRIDPAGIPLGDTAAPYPEDKDEDDDDDLEAHIAEQVHAPQQTEPERRSESSGAIGT